MQNNGQATKIAPSHQSTADLYRSISLSIDELWRAVRRCPEATGSTFGYGSLLESFTLMMPQYIINEIRVDLLVVVQMYLQSSFFVIVQSLQ